MSDCTCTVGADNMDLIPCRECLGKVTTYQLGRRIGEDPAAPLLHAARCALAQATFDARQACSFLRDDQAEESVKAYLRECQRRGLDPMAILR